MRYYKDLVRLAWVLFFLNLLFTASYAKEDTIDLGETGFSSPVQFKETDKDYAGQYILRNIPKNINLKEIKFFYKSALPKHEGPSTTRRSSFRKNLGLPAGVKIFVFSCYDPESARVAPTLNLDYGLCIEYKSLDDIRDFKERVGIRQPVQIANDEMVKALGVTSYPALITVREDELEIQEGF